MFRTPSKPDGSITMDTSADARVAQGLALHQSGRLAEAEQHYRLALAQDPRHFSALHLLGVVCLQTGRLDDGVDHLQQALRVRADVPAACTDLGTALIRLNRFEEALSLCDQAIRIDPRYGPAFGNRGGALVQLGRWEDALGAYRRQVEIDPANARAHLNVGTVLRSLGRLEDALDSFDRALAAAPDFADAFRYRGVTLFDLGRLEEALESHSQAIVLGGASAQGYFGLGTTLLGLRRLDDALLFLDEALQAQPTFSQAHSYRGVVLAELDRPEEALDAFSRAIALDPGNVHAFCNQVGPLLALGRPAQALASCETALTLDPDHAEAHHNKAAVLYELRDLEGVLACCNRAIAVKPTLAEAYNARGVALFELRRLPDAIASLETGLAHAPGDAEARHHLAMVRLASGELRPGWDLYESRWDTRQFARMRRSLAQPLWLGQDTLAGRTLLVHAEQGLGDTLQFCRYVPRLADRGARIVFEVQPGLAPLLASLAGVAHILSRGEPLPPFDVQVPLMSLPLALDAGPESLSSPYLVADPARTAAWARRLGPAHDLRVGLVWGGGTRPDDRVAHLTDLRRSLPLSALRPLLEVPGIRFHSLQLGPPAQQLADLRARDAIWGSIRDVAPDLKDFSDTAAAMAQLDLVITCDTAAAHLAGALGVPVWILNRFDACWRWFGGDGPTPWYPSAKLFRQAQPGDWDSVIALVKADLQRLSAARLGD